MQGAFLHILADTMGSVGVIISTLLIDWFGWHRADPIASIFIALMTLISVKPLLTETTTTLLQRSPPELDDTLPTAYSQLLRLEGVERLEEAHSWTLAKGQTICSVKIKTTIDANPRKWVSTSSNSRSLMNETSPAAVFNNSRIFLGSLKMQQTRSWRRAFTASLFTSTKKIAKKLFYLSILWIQTIRREWNLKEIHRYCCLYREQALWWRVQTCL